MSRRMPLVALLLSLLSFLAGSANAASSRPVLVFIDAPELPSRIYALPAAFGPAFTPQPLSLSLYVPDTDAIYACDNDERLPSLSAGDAVLVWRGHNCSFAEKARSVAASGATVMIVVNIDTSVTTMSGVESDGDNVSVMSVMIGSDDGEMLLSSSTTTITVTGYVRPLFDWSFVAMLAIAVMTVIVGGLMSAAKDRQKQRQRSLPHPGTSASADNDSEEQVIAYMDTTAALSFVCCASLSLIVLFYFIQYLIYALLLLFAFGSGQALYALLNQCLATYCTSSNAKYAVNSPLRLRITKWQLVSLVIAVTMSTVWLVYRRHYYAFVLQDWLGICLLLQIQRLLRLPNIAISSLLLTLVFAYDVFMVFISPYFFNGSSVMVAVASGGGTGEAVPMLLRLPRFNDPMGGMTMLGLGDIALPSLFLSFLARFDAQKRIDWRAPSYFLVSVIGYTVGLVLTYVALVAMSQGQPALLYIVPCILVPVLALAKWRGDLRVMWRGTEEERQEQRRQLTRLTGQSPSHSSSSSSSLLASKDAPSQSSLSTSLLIGASDSEEADDGMV